MELRPLKLGEFTHRALGDDFEDGFSRWVGFLTGDGCLGFFGGRFMLEV